jgi:hypothetical protein
MKGVAQINEAKSEHASVKYRGYLVAGVERWLEYREQLTALKKKPILFVMLNSTEEADDVGDWLRTKYPKDFKEIERDYTIPEPQTPQEVIGYYARRIAEAVKLPSQFAALAPKVREFFEHKAFGQTVDLESKTAIRAMSTNVAHFVCVQTFKKALLNLTIEAQEPQLLEPARMLSTTPPFPWSRPVWEGRKCVFNLVPCDNAFERAFAKFLDGAVT